MHFLPLCCRCCRLGWILECILGLFMQNFTICCGCGCTTYNKGVRTSCIASRLHPGPDQSVGLVVMAAHTFRNIVCSSKSSLLHKIASYGRSAKARVICPWTAVTTRKLLRLAVLLTPLRFRALGTASCSVTTACCVLPVQEAVIRSIRNIV